ncbi:MAG: ribonuclease III domain-containing protein [Firmicutes bacterium]|nr:ribonuclease III domain-containing protein [Bacillota bacterium]
MMNDAIKILAQEYGIKTKEGLAIFNKAFNVTKISKENYKNSSLATLGDVVIKLYISEELYLRGLSKGEITEKKKRMENNNRLKQIADKSGWTELTFTEQQKQETDQKKNDPSTLFEAVFGAIYLVRGLKEAYRMLADLKILDMVDEE